jgi:hypothetical protein
MRRYNGPRSRVIPLIIAAVLGSIVLAAPSAQAGTPQIGRLQLTKYRLDWTPPRTAAQTAALRRQSAAATPIQDFTKNIIDGSTTFTYTMIGKDPFVHQAAPSTTIKTYLQPVVFHFANGHNYDPTVADSCDSGASPLKRTQQSPVFNAQAWSFGGKSVGSAQYVDASQRAEFYTQTKPTGVNPGYHVNLTLVTLAKITVNVPAASSSEGTTSCGNRLFGAVELGYWDNLVQHTLLHNMAAKGLTLRDFPLFLFKNVVMYIGSPSQCCVLGYHNSMGTGTTFQSYGNALYNSAHLFSSSGCNCDDVAVMTHEVSEWMNDPDTSNATKPWGHIGQVQGCQNNLETGDPLSGTSVSDVLNGHTYHVQELAFYSWFYHHKPSQGVNGWYSDFGKFKVAASPCS